MRSFSDITFKIQQDRLNGLQSCFEVPRENTIWGVEMKKGENGTEIIPKPDSSICHFIFVLPSEGFLSQVRLP